MRRVRGSVIRDGQDTGAAGRPQKAPAWRGHGRSARQNATRPLKQGTLTLATTWTDLRGAVLGEVSQTGTDTARPRGHVGPRKRLTGKRSDPWSPEAGRGRGAGDRGAGSTDGSVLGTQCTAWGPQPACRVTWEGLLRGQTPSARPRENVAPPPPHLPGETARPAPAALTTSQRTDTPRTMNSHGDACPLRLSDGGRGPCSCPLQDTMGVPAVTVLGWQPRPPNKWV